MSVPAWERDKSKTDFIRLLMELNIRMGTMDELFRDLFGGE